MITEAKSVRKIEETHRSLGFYEIHDLRTILTAPRVQLGSWPTPLEYCPLFPNFQIKRDDLSGYGRGGIKTRKLEAMLAFLRQKRVSDLIVLVPNISNLRSDLELYQRTHDAELKLHLFISNIPFLPAQQRLSLVVGRTSYTLTGKNGFSIVCRMLGKRLQLGKRAMLVLPSIMHPAAVTGAANGLLELYLQCIQQGRPLPKHIFISACTGSSAAGLLLAANILREHKLADITINVVKVYRGPLRWWLRLLLYWTKRVYKLETALSMDGLKIHQHCSQEYGSGNASLVSTCRRVKAEFGINVDPIYGARAWEVMEGCLRNSYTGQETLYWHCGFTPDWDFNLSEKFSAG